MRSSAVPPHPLIAAASLPPPPHAAPAVISEPPPGFPLRRYMPGASGFLPPLSAAHLLDKDPRAAEVEPGGTGGS
ncbi:unnamed protein product, partial [Nesidiocoris tenuis]